LIEIPEEGLRTKICRRDCEQEVLCLAPKGGDPVCRENGLCDYDGKPCDAQAYRIAKEKAMNGDLRDKIDYIVKVHRIIHPEEDWKDKIEQAFLDVGYRQFPSEKELALWLVGHLEYTSSELAKKLLKFMKEA